MAASVSYRINGTYDDKAMKNAKNGVNDLSEAGKKAAKSLAAIGAVVGTIKKVINISKECSATFKENNTVQTQFYQSLSKNTKMASEDMTKLVKEFDGMAGYFEGSEIVKAGNFLAQMGLDEQSLRISIQLSKDLAASGLMSLDQAAQAVGKTYAGTAGTLGKLFPEIKAMTKEELSQGKAVEFLTQKYSGMEEQMSKTFDGIDRVYANKLDGIKDSIGSIYSNISAMIKISLMPWLDRISQWFDENKIKIFNIVYRLPEIIIAVFNTIKSIIKQFTEGDALERLMDNIGKNIAALANNILNTTKALLTGIINAIVAFINNLETGGIAALFLNLLKKIYNDTVREFLRIGDVVYELIEGEGSIGERISNAAQIALGLKTGGLNKMADEKGVKLGYSVIDPESLQNAKNEAMAAISEAAKEIGSEGFKLIKETNSNNNEFLRTFENDIKKFAVEFKRITGQELPQELIDAWNYGASQNKNETNINNSIPTSWYQQQAQQNTDLWNRFLAWEEEQKGTGTNNNNTFNSIMGQFGDFGTIMQSLINSTGWIGILIQMIGSLVSDMKEKSQIFADFLDFFSILANRINDPRVVEFFDRTLVPIMNILGNIASILASIINPLLEAFGPLLENVLKIINVVFNYIGAAAMMLANAFIAISNAFRWLTGAKYTDYYTWDQIGAQANGSNNAYTYTPMSTPETNYSSANASYNAARDVYVTINYDRSYVNGDARDIAISIYNEIKSAGQLGYIV